MVKKSDIYKNKKYTMIVGLALILIMIWSGVYFVNNLESTDQFLVPTQDSSCPPGSTPNPSVPGCDYGADPTHINSYAHEDKDPDPQCNKDHCMFADVSQSDECNYTHDQVCVQKEGWNNTRNQCVFSCDWECCNWDGPQGDPAEKVIAVGPGEIIPEDEYYTDGGIDGRFEDADCSALSGWGGVKGSVQLQPNIFFTVGALLENGGVVFNPEVRIDDEREDGSIVCDFLDAKGTGVRVECQECAGEACNHGFTVDLTQHTDSPIFNGEANNKIFAYVANGEQIELIPNSDLSANYNVIDASCGNTWDGKADLVPGTNTPTTGGNTGGGDEGNSPANLNNDTKVDISDFAVFAGDYVGCANGDTSSCTSDSDLNNDNTVNLSDFGIFKEEYLKYN